MTKYQVWNTDHWTTCRKASVTSKGWLDFLLADGTRGLARPGNWREKPAKETVK